MKKTILSRWDAPFEGDDGRRYFLPAGLLRPISDLLCRRKNAERFMRVLLYLCRKHSLDPERAFPLDRRAIGTKLKINEYGV